MVVVAPKNDAWFAWPRNKGVRDLSELPVDVLSSF